VRIGCSIVNVKRRAGTILFVVFAMGAAGVVCQGRVRLALQNPTPSIVVAAGADTSRKLPEFICTVRAYGGAGYDDFQRSSMRGLGIDYVQGLVDFTWDHIERVDNVWKWVATDEQMDQLAKSGLKVVAFLICPKSPGLPWDETITRADPRFAAQYEEFAYQVVNRYHKRPAWSGLIAVWGGSSDVFGDHPFHAPEVQVPLINAAYEGIKRADPQTIVISFNLSTSISTPRQWEEWFEKAFSLHPKFDWVGVHTYYTPVTGLESPGAYSGAVGLVNVRKFLDAHGYADKPLWLNEGGFGCGDDLGGLPEQTHAEQVVETYVVARTLNANMRGWVYFEYFSKTHLFEESSADPGLCLQVPRSRQAHVAALGGFLRAGDGQASAGPPGCHDPHRSGRSMHADRYVRRVERSSRRLCRERDGRRVELAGLSESGGIAANDRRRRRLYAASPCIRINSPQMVDRNSCASDYPDICASGDGRAKRGRRSPPRAAQGLGE